MEGNSTTRERVLAAALELFGSKGYDAVSMNDIAEAVGIRAPSLYKHFAGKDALFAAVAPAAEAHYQSLWSGVAAAQSQLERDVRTLGSLAAERLEQETMGWLHKELENGRDYRAFVDRSGLGARWLWDEPLSLYERFFARLVELQAVKRGDVHVIAVEYLAPIFQLMTLADGDATRRFSVTEEIRKHIRQFHRAFAVRPATSNSGGVLGLFRR